jgi:hypothetical protein
MRRTTLSELVAIEIDRVVERASPSRRHRLLRTASGMVTLARMRAPPEAMTITVSDAHVVERFSTASRDFNRNDARSDKTVAC